MGLIKAIGKLSAKMANDGYTNIQVKKAGSRAFKQTGKQIAKAKKNGTYVDGSKLFRQNKSHNIKTAVRRGKYRDGFISDL